MHAVMAGSGLPVQEASRGSQCVFYALRRWWPIFLPAGVLLAAAGAALVYFLFVPQYEAMTLLEIEEQPQFIAFEPRQGERSKGYFATQIQLIQSAWILGRVVEQPAIAELPELRKQADPIAWLSKAIKVVSLGESNAFKITYASKDPRNAAMVANEVTSQYLKARSETEAARSKEIIRTLTREIHARHDAVAELREQVAAMMKRIHATGSQLATLESSGESHPLADLQSRLRTVQTDRTMLEARIKATEEQLEMEKADPLAPSAAAKAPLTSDECEMRDALVDRALAEDAEVRQRTNALQAKRAYLNKIEEVLVLGKRAPKYLSQEAEIRRDEQALDKFKDELRGRVQKEMEVSMRTNKKAAVAASVAKRREDAAQLRWLLRSDDIAEQNLKAEYATLLKEMEKDGSETGELLAKREELTQSERVLDRITSRQIELQTEQGAPPRVIWHQSAVPPEAPVEDIPYRNLAIAVLVGLCLPFGIAVAWERHVGRIGDASFLRQQSALTVLGETTRLPARSRSVRPSAESRIGAELGMFEESIDSLRTSLMLSVHLADVRILAVTSAVAQEGKTSVAAQLAISLARATGEMVLLIDCDTRSPDVHNVFGIPLEPGLADVLAHTCPLDQAIVTTWSNHVHLLPAGQLSGSPHQLFGNGSWKMLLDRIPGTYRHVVVDTPPVLAASESLVLAKSADATLLCVMRDVSRMDQVQQTADRLFTVGGHLAGTVLNGVPANRFAHYYGYGG